MDIDVISIINELDENKFLLLFNQIFEFIAKEGVCNFETFISTEKDKLVAGLETDVNVLNQLLTSLVSVIKQVCYNVTEPPYHEAQFVKDLNLNENKTKLFSNIWAQHEKLVLQKLKQDTVYKYQLDNVNCMVNVTTATDTVTQTFIPRAMIDLKMKNNSSMKLKDENVILDFNKEELYKFFNMLQNIQSHLNHL